MRNAGTGEATLTRTVRFRARHHYARPDWPEERNRAVFGETVHPHAHDYTLQVTVAGTIDPETGFLVDLGKLDSLLQREVVARLDRGDLNDEIPEVREGSMLPSTESLARWFWRLLDERIPPPARLERIRVAEGPELWAEYREAPGRGG